GEQAPENREHQAIGRTGMLLQSSVEKLWHYDVVKFIELAPGRVQKVSSRNIYDPQGKCKKVLFRRYFTTTASALAAKIATFCPNFSYSLKTSRI
ncbi:MAG: hypothetical protein M3R60_14950, partial [Pseudomonadota bacterium]|nr:hypothetical protein [Pseudomonadota bacterium]